MSEFGRYRRRYESDSNWVKWIIISMLVSGALAIGLRAWVLHQTQDMMQDIVDHGQQASQKVLDRHQAQQAQRLRQQQEAEHREALDLAQQQRAHEAHLARMARKEAAWEAFFKPTPQCQRDPVTVECANAHIRAKGQFEETYRDPV